MGKFCTDLFDPQSIQIDSFNYFLVITIIIVPTKYKNMLYFFKQVEIDRIHVNLKDMSILIEHEFLTKRVAWVASYLCQLA